MQLIGKLTPQSTLIGNLNGIGALQGTVNQPSYVTELQNEIDKLADRLDNLRVEDLVDGEDYATKEYVDVHGGKINSISVNGVPQEIDINKNVDLDIPKYFAGNGLTLSNNVFALDELIIECGTSTTVM